MFRRTTPTSEAASPPHPIADRSGLLALLGLSAWCGLVAGLLEVAAIVLRKRLVDPDQLYGLSRHFVWMIPLIDLGLFLALGGLGWMAARAWPRRGRRLVGRILGALTILPALLVAFPRIYSLAWLVVALGAATRLAPLAERHPRGLRRLARATSPAALAIALALAASPWVGDRIRRAREAARPLPPPGSANVLLIVLDTVAAGHLSLHGYHRPTSPTLAEVAERGIRFDAARSACSWTLPSHATMFTGRWMHELSAGWITPLDGARPTLAEYLGSRG
jgi:glucan phosphoethanolaminetransferase (alkaline phosphatase superfamily)